MKYLSTRGGESRLSFQEVLFSGYASDGGLYFPETLPQLSMEHLLKWQQLSYIQLMQEISALFIDEAEIPREDLDFLIAKAFENNFPKEVVPLRQLGNDLFIVELFHGPTLTFKDLALSVIGQLFDYFLQKQQKHKIVLVGTSGDTGSAAISAVKGLKWVDIVVLLPKGRCTLIQERQMTTVLADNVHNFAVEGTSDDLDVPIKNAFEDQDFADRHNLCSINSINWARVLFQMTHFAYAYFKVCKVIGDSIEVVVPTGACGNITAGYILHEMGFPIHLVAAVAPNDIVHRALSMGDLSANSEVASSWASAIDIQVPYNLERIVFMASGCNWQETRNIFQQFEATQQSVIPPAIVNSIRNCITDTICVSNEDIIDQIRTCFKAYDYIVCPHTAVALKYHFARPNRGQLACIATASPAKFPEAMKAAGIYQSDQESPELARLLEMPTRFEWMRSGDDWNDILYKKLQTITDRRQTSS